MADLGDVFEDLRGRGVHVDRDDVGARHHHLVHRLLRDREDRRDHALLPFLKDALRLSRFDEGLDLVLGDQRERPGMRVCAEGPRDQPGQVEEHRDKRSREPGDELERPDQNEEDGLRMPSPDRARHEETEKHGDE